MFAACTTRHVNRLMLWFLGYGLATAVVLGDETPASTDVAAPPDREASSQTDWADPPGTRRLAPDASAWIDTKRRTVIVDGRVCLREGPLEMFACPHGTKEHESIVAVNTKAYLIHAALLALGAKPGNTVRYFPDYVPASGTQVDIHILWIDNERKKQRARAQEWVRQTQTKKAMDQVWVFAGSGFYKDQETGREYYQAEGGDLICVSNFPSAMLDLPVESPQTNDMLLFEAFTERIPPRGTHVRLVLEPQLPDPM